VVKAFAGPIPTGGREVDEEAVGLQVVENVKCAFTCVPGTSDQGTGISVAGVREEPRPRRRQHVDGRSWMESWLEETAPSGDQAVSSELQELQLGPSSALEEEALQLLPVEVSILA